MTEQHPPVDVLGKEIPTGRRALEAYINETGRDGAIGPVLLEQLNNILFFCDGYERVPVDPHRTTPGILTQKGREIVAKVSSTPERLQHFLEAIIQAAYRAGTARRPDMISLDSLDAWVVDQVMKGTENFTPLYGGKTEADRKEDDKVYALLVKAFGPDVIDGTVKK